MFSDGVVQARVKKGCRGGRRWPSACRGSFFRPWLQFRYIEQENFAEFEKEMKTKPSGVEEAIDFVWAAAVAIVLVSI